MDREIYHRSVKMLKKRQCEKFWTSQIALPCKKNEIKVDICLKKKKKKDSQKGFCKPNQGYWKKSLALEDHSEEESMK